MDMEKTGTYLASLRRGRDMTQQQVADILGVSNKTVSKWESGAGLPDIAALPALAALYGVTADDIASVELAGGFGNYLSPENAVRIGMLPRACLSKIRPLGNAALAGASMLALDGENWRKLAEIPKKCRYLELSGRDDFSRAFTDSLTF